MKSREKSVELLEKLKSVTPGGCNSPARAFTSLSMTPLMASEGRGDLLIDVDGHEYIDFNNSWGSLILGHVDLFVVANATDQLSHGSSFGVSTELEYLLAKKITELVETAEKVRFVSSGTEATMTAVRVARGYTKKNIIIKFNGHYHGHSDAFLVKAGSGVADHFDDASSRGVPSEAVSHTISIPFNDEKIFLEVFEKHKDNLAGVILEPVAGNMGCVPSNEKFLQLLREKTNEVGALLIFDEVITGFRVARGGATEIYQIKPDLHCFGKIIGAGFPVAAIAGKKQVMDQLAPIGDVYQAGTLSGNPVAMRAGLAVLTVIEKEQFYEKLMKTFENFLAPIESAIEASNYPLCLQKSGLMFSIFFGLEKVTKFEDLETMDREMFEEFFKYLFEKGVYISPSAYEASCISNAHTKEHLEKAQTLIINFIQSIDAKISSRTLKKDYAKSN